MAPSGERKPLVRDAVKPRQRRRHPVQCEERQVRPNDARAFHALPSSEAVDDQEQRTADGQRGENGAEQAPGLVHEGSPVVIARQGGREDQHGGDTERLPVRRDIQDRAATADEVYEDCGYAHGQNPRCPTQTCRRIVTMPSVACPVGARRAGPSPPIIDAIMIQSSGVPRPFRYLQIGKQPLEFVSPVSVPNWPP